MFAKIANQITLKSSFKTSPNIGLIKYWGKWDEKEIIPLNTNIGITLDYNLSTTTTVYLNRESNKSNLIINNKQFPISDRIQRILDITKTELCNLSSLKSQKWRNSPTPDKSLQELIPNIQECGFHIESSNSFPTGSGLASSSSGLSALALCVNSIVLNSLDVRYLSRIGSGSACRCLFGNFVLFPGVSLQNLDSKFNVKEESAKCLPYELENSRWLKDIMSVVILTDQHTGQKEVLSRDGMKLTWETSQLIQERVRRGVDIHIKQMMNALDTKNYNDLMKVIMQDSNQFHATCMDTYPPLLYLSDFSREIISIIHKFNKNSEFQIGYTFDAGPHAVVLVHNRVKEQFKEKIQNYNQIWSNIGDGPIEIIE